MWSQEKTIELLEVFLNFTIGVRNISYEGNLCGI